jgi:hypothetical protein
MISLDSIIEKLYSYKPSTTTSSGLSMLLQDFMQIHCMRVIVHGISEGVVNRSYNQMGWCGCTAAIDAIWVLSGYA